MYKLYLVTTLFVKRQEKKCIHFVCFNESILVDAFAASHFNQM